MGAATGVELTEHRDLVVATVERELDDTGFNAATGQYEDLAKAATVDSAKIVKAALARAASVAAVVLTSEVLAVHTR